MSYLHFLAGPIAAIPSECDSPIEFGNHSPPVPAPGTVLVRGSSHPRALIGRMRASALFLVGSQRPEGRERTARSAQSPDCRPGLFRRESAVAGACRVGIDEHE